MNAVMVELADLIGGRDKRASNRMDADTKLIHLRLEAWGTWAKSHEVHAWPESTLLGRVIEHGVTGAAQGSRPPISMPTAIAVVDTAIARLGGIDRKVIKVYYLHWESAEDMARRARMRVKEFQNVLRRARWRIGGYVAAMEERFDTSIKNLDSDKVR